MKEVLFLNTMQSDQQWNADCVSIANNVLKELDYDLPNNIYTNNFIDFIIKFIKDESIGAYDVDDIQNMLDNISRESFDNSQSQNDNIEYYDFNSSTDEIYKINKLIVKNITSYYKKSNLVENLKKVNNDVLFVYYNSSCKNILSLLYKHNNPIFNSTTNSYEKTIEEIKIIISKDLTIIKL